MAYWHIGICKIARRLSLVMARQGVQVKFCSLVKKKKRKPNQSTSECQLKSKLGDFVKMKSLQGFLDIPGSLKENCHEASERDFEILINSVI